MNDFPLSPEGRPGHRPGERPEGELAAAAPEPATERETAVPSLPDTRNPRWFATLLAVLGLCAVALVGGLWWKRDALIVTHAPPAEVDWQDPAALAPALAQDAAAQLADLQFTALDGAPLRLADLRGRPVLLNFWASWCAPCLREMPELDAVAQLYAPHQLRVIVASLDATPAVAREALAARALTHVTAVMDENGRQFARFRAGGLPLTLLIRPDGSLAERINGFRRWDARAMREKINALYASAPGS